MIIIDVNNREKYQKSMCRYPLSYICNRLISLDWAETLVLLIGINAFQKRLVVSEDNFFSRFY